MTCGSTTPVSCCNQQITCPDVFGCPPGLCPDFQIRRHDTLPQFRVSVNDCNGPLDLTDTIVEVSMWAKGKMKKAVSNTDTYFGLADDVGFFQINIGDVIVVDRIRNPEQMIVQGFDEDLKLVQVRRGYNGTAAGTYKKGQSLKIFRILNAVGETNIVEQDFPQLDGTVETNVVTDSQLVYSWNSQDTCLPGCYWLEFKLLKMLAPPSSLSFWDVTPLKSCVPYSISTVSIIPSVVPSFIPTVSGCDIGTGVEWVRRFPVQGEGFLIQIINTSTAENVVS